MSASARTVTSLMSCTCSSESDEGPSVVDPSDSRSGPGGPTGCFGAFTVHPLPGHSRRWATPVVVLPRGGDVPRGHGFEASDTSRQSSARICPIRCLGVQRSTSRGSGLGRAEVFHALPLPLVQCQPWCPEGDGHAPCTTEHRLHRHPCQRNRDGERSTLWAWARWRRDDEVPTPEGTVVTTYEVGYFVGSLSTQSINRMLANALVRLAPDDLSLVEIPIKDLPLYNRDFDVEYPPAGVALKEAISRVDAVL